MQYLAKPQKEVYYNTSFYFLSEKLLSISQAMDCLRPVSSSRGTLLENIEGRGVLKLHSQKNKKTLNQGHIGFFSRSVRMDNILLCGKYTVV